MRFGAACWCCKREQGKLHGWCTQNKPVAAQNGRSCHCLQLQQLQPTEGWGASSGAPAPAPLHPSASAVPQPAGWLHPAACAGSLRGMGRACEAGSGRGCTLGRAVGPVGRRRCAAACINPPDPARAAQSWLNPAQAGVLQCRGASGCPPRLSLWLGRAHLPPPPPQRRPHTEPPAEPHASS